MLYLPTNVLMDRIMHICPGIHMYPHLYLCTHTNTIMDMISTHICGNTHTLTHLHTDTM